MAANGPLQTLRGIISDLREYFLPHPVEPVEVPIAPRNARPLSEQEVAQLRREQAKAIDKYFDEELDKKNYDEINNKSRSLQWMPDIRPADRLWRQTRAYYAELIKSERISDVLDENYEEMQKILINPQAWSVEVQAVRDEQSKEYYENIGPGGRFEGQLDNLATKMTMVHFGLPVAPMTLNNIMVLTPDWKDDADDEEDPAPSPPRTQRIIYSEKPLEFLDSYIERSFGYQIIRRPRVSMRGGAGSIEELELADSSDGEWRSTVTMRGGADRRERAPLLRGLYLNLLGPSPKHKSRRTHLVQREFLNSAHRLLGIPNDVDLHFNVDIYRQVDPRKIDKPLQISFSIASHEDFEKKWPSIEEVIGKVDHDQLSIIIEDRFPDEDVPMFYEDVRRLAKEFPDDDKKTSQHPIYSYFGKKLTRPTYLAFKDTVTKLLNIDPRSDWSFLVDVHTEDRILPPLHFTRTQYRNDFLSLRDKFLIGASSKTSVFVRNVSGYAPSQHQVVEPPQDSQIVRLYSQQENAESYWKIPLVLNPVLPYCLNHLQPSFVRAFLAIYGQDRPSRNPRLSSTQEGVHEQALNFGGMEVTPQTWEWVVDRVRQQKNLPKPVPQPDDDSDAETEVDLSCQLTITIPPHSDMRKKPEDTIYLHLIGDDYQRDIAFERNEYQHIYSFIVERLRKVHRHSQNSKYPNGSLVAMWFSAIEREENRPPVIMEIDDDLPDAEKGNMIRTAFLGRVQTFSNIWFRPEYQVFTLHDNSEGERIWQWDTTDEQHNTSLENFRANMREMYDDWDHALDSNFVLLQTKTNRSFAVDRRTTESYWRKYIFDWLTETDIFIERRETRPFMQPDTIPWGYRHTRQIPPPPPVELNPVPVAPVAEASQQPRINKTRLIAPVAEKAITPKWETWMTDQHRKDALQRRSYIQDQSVIEPGLDPSAPTYGPSKELTLGVSLSTPAVYTQRLTPTDILNLVEENQKLRNGLLERSHNCLICSVTMAGYDHAEIQRHYGQHLVQLQKEGQCPLCERESWSIMTMEQKKEHLETHQVETDTEMIRNFWNGIECPVCDAKLSGFTAEQVLRHMADHIPGIVEFCDKCGLRTAICNHAELVHHRYVCLDQPDRGPLDLEPSFCGDCGQNRTAEDEEERGQHVINCTAKNRRVQDKKFCTKCGIDKSAWSNDEITTHDEHCTSPQGLPKAFCLRCGTRLLGATEAQLDDHRVYCSIRTKEPENLRQRVEELQARTATLNRIAAKNAATLSWITQRENELVESERALAERESKRPMDERRAYAEDRSSLGACPWSRKGCKYHTINQTRRQIFTHMATHFNADQSKTLPFTCPFPGCSKQIAVPGSDPDDNLLVVDHYRHRDYQGIADVHGPPKGRDPKELKKLVDHFQKANAMNARTRLRNITPLPEPGQGQGTGGAGAGGFGGGLGGGLGSRFQYSDSSRLETGYAYHPSHLPSDDDLQQSIEADYVQYGDDENLFQAGDYEPPSEAETDPGVEIEISQPTPTRRHRSFAAPLDSYDKPYSTYTPKSISQPPPLPYSPTKRKASAAIPEEDLYPPSNRTTRQRTAIQTPSPDIEAPPVRRSIRQDRRRKSMHGVDQDGDADEGETREVKSQDWKNMMDTYEAETSQINQYESSGGDSSEQAQVHEEVEGKNESSEQVTSTSNSNRSPSPAPKVKRYRTRSGG
ncbi:uncharacterized protein EAE98_005153 [Botrytis deweyae]|uniref:C2H2-type domain-containing protein n=1 Tax=Botrytis deweyae TaxID=2478750 RepID=A0ABQ7IP04_9HELO|nr:uncharacterized protein EAE98_005153 [Botrytis deweyae]KAF7929234.1 hypothetical protein EAE98_005153 [Botrytis deweyae]